MRIYILTVKHLRHIYLFTQVYLKEEKKNRKKVALVCCLLRTRGMV